ncbi:MAG: BatA domain-containing protein [Candidatus Zixiibacteriota bacterium]
MFNFLNATILLAAAAALIPLIIHLFSKRRVKIIEFSSLRYLKAMQRRQVRRLKIRQVLLLILRMLIIFVAVMAFARPTTKSNLVGAHAAVSAVVLFDNSASMNRYVADGNLFTLARQKTSELLETFSPADEVSLVPLGGAAETDEAIEFSSAAVALKKLEQTRLSYGYADFATSLELTVELLNRSKNLNREIYIVSDRQRTDLPENKLLENVKAEVYILELPTDDNDNCGVISLDFGGQLIQPGYNFNLTATVKNYGGEDKNDVLASLFIDEKRLSQTNFDIKAESETRVSFEQSVSRTGFHSGYVEIADDRYMVDNRFYFSFHVPERFNLLIISGDYASTFMALALVPDRTLSRFWSVKQAAPEDLAGVDFQDYDVVFLAGAPTLSEVYVNRLKSFVRRGKALLVSYSANTDINYFNDRWSTVTGVVYDEPVPRNFSRAGYYTLQALEMNHPIFSVYDFKNSQPPEIKFYTLPKLHLGQDVRVLARFSGDRPALTETRFGTGKVLTFTAPLSPEYSDFTGHAFFVPFISRSAEYLASDLSTLDLRLFSQRQTTRTLSLTGSVSYAVELVTPDSGRYNIPPEEDQGALVLKARPTDLPGVYRINYQSREIDRFAINIDPAEGNLARADLDQFAVALGAEDYRPLGAEPALASIISEYRYGRELWQIFLWLAAALIAAEMLLARSAPPEE